VPMASELRLPIIPLRLGWKRQHSLERRFVLFYSY